MTTFSRRSLNCLAAAIIITLALSSTSHAALILGLNANDIVQADGSPVGAWGGSVGSTFNCCGGGAPTFRQTSTALNGNASVDFDATDDGLGTSAAGLTAGNFTVMALYAWDGTAGFHRVVQGNTNWLMGPYNGQHQLYNGGFVTGGAATAGVPVISTGTSAGFYLNGSFIGAGPATTTPGSIGLGTVGFAAETAASDVGLVLVFNTQLTNDQRVGTEWIMAQEFGVAGFVATKTQIAAGTAALGGFLAPAPPVGGTILVDMITGAGAPNSPIADATDFTTAGVVGLTGSESVDTLTSSVGTANHPAGTVTTAAGVQVTFSGAYGGFGLNNTQVANAGGLNAPQDLLRDYIFINAGSLNVSIGNLDLDPNTMYTLYLFGNIDAAFDQDSIFTPVNGDVTFVSTLATSESLAVNFTTGGTWDDLNDTIDFIWDREDALGDFNGFAIVLAPSQATAPEPSTFVLAALGLLGFIGTHRRRRR